MELMVSFTSPVEEINRDFFFVTEQEKSLEFL